MPEHPEDQINREIARRYSSLAREIETYTRGIRDRFPDSTNFYLSQMETLSAHLRRMATSARNAVRIVQPLRQKKTF